MKRDVRGPSGMNRTTRTEALDLGWCDHGGERGGFDGLIGSSSEKDTNYGRFSGKGPRELEERDLTGCGMVEAEKSYSEMSMDELKQLLALALEEKEQIDEEIEKVRRFASRRSKKKRWRKLV